MDVTVSFRLRRPRGAEDDPGGSALRRIRVAPDTPLLEAARRAGLPVARACGGAGLCGRCGLQVLEGAGRLSPEAEDEVRARRRNRVPEGQRLACRARARGAVTATATYW